MDFKSYSLAVILFAAILMGIGVFWQHTRYVALNEQYKSLTEANKGLAEASDRAKKVDAVKQGASTKVVEVIVEKTKVVEQQKKVVDEVVAQGTPNEKDFMSRPLPPDLVRVLDLAYQGTYQGRD